ncbi:ABC transporter permease [Micromonospora radicis]|uniref:ABC transporter permease subunit n=1 Tax=Micromonospora radicis TaxID=1894971 RepID=A0A418MXD4_9ACTN|nr:ABC transporter permease subunit [Micromonospora radicis]RIV39218.1 ABC transporter permease subunit [Micromonospora radicis]
MILHLWRPDAAAGTSSRSRTRRTRKALSVAGSTLLALGCWQGIAAFAGLPAGAFPSITELVRAAGVEITQPTLWQAIGQTLSGAMTGLAIAIAVGLPLGAALGSSDRAFRAVRFVLEFLRATPAPAILPLVVLLLGSGLRMQVLMVVFGCVFPVLLQTVYGVRDIDPLALETARAFRVGRWRAFRSVTLPAALPFAFTGIRIAGSIALLVAVAVEVLVWSSGLGAGINNAAIANRPATMYVFIAVTGALGIAMNAATSVVQRHFLDYQPSARTS